MLSSADSPFCSFTYSRQLTIWHAEWGLRSLSEAAAHGIDGHSPLPTKGGAVEVQWAFLRLIGKPAARCREVPIYRAAEEAERRLHGLSKYTRKPTRERLVDGLIDRKLLVEAQIEKWAQMVF